MGSIAQDIAYCMEIMPSANNNFGADFRTNATEVEAHAMDLLFPVRFCHRDLLGGNCLIPVDGKLDELSDNMKIIDYEYAAYDFVGCDIANHFNAVVESFMIVHKKFDMAQFPSRECRKRFIKYYIEGRDLAERRREKTRPSDAMLDAAVTLCLRFSLATELRWGLWAIIQAAHSGVEFDYITYAKQRLQAYHEFKCMLEGDSLHDETELR